MKNKEFLVIVIGIFFTIIAWMVIDLYHIKTNKAVGTDVKPVTLTKFDEYKSILDTLKSKK